MTEVRNQYTVLTWYFIIKRTLRSVPESAKLLNLYRITQCNIWKGCYNALGVSRWSEKKKKKKKKKDFSDAIRQNSFRYFHWMPFRSTSHPHLKLRPGLTFTFFFSDKLYMYTETYSVVIFDSFDYIRCELKRKPRFNTKSLKIKKTKHKIVISGWYSIFIFLSYGTLVLHMGQGLLLSNHFCKACQNCLHPSFVIVHKAVRMH